MPAQEKHTDPLAEKFWSLRGSKDKFSEALRKSFISIVYFQKKISDTLTGEQDAKIANQENIQTITREEFTLTMLVSDCWLAAHINTLDRYGDKTMAEKLRSFGAIDSRLYQNIEFSIRDFPKLKSLQPKETDTVLINFISLIELFNKSKLKFDKPEDFSLMTSWILKSLDLKIAQKNNDSDQWNTVSLEQTSNENKSSTVSPELISKLLVQEPKEINDDSQYELIYMNIISSTLSVTPDLIQRILRKLKIQSFFIVKNSETIIAPIKMMQSFWQEFLTALVDQDHQSFPDAYNLFSTLTKNFGQNSSIGLIGQIISSLSDGLANRYHSQISGYKLNIPIGQWIKQFCELEDLQTDQEERSYKILRLSQLIISFIERSEYKNCSPIISVETALKQASPYWRAAEPNLAILENEPTQDTNNLFESILALLDSKVPKKTSSFNAAIDLINQIIDPITDEIKNKTDSNDKLIYPEILANYPFLSQLKTPITLAAADFTELPKLFGNNLIRVVISSNDKKTENESQPSPKIDFLVYFRTVKSDYVNANATEQFFRFTLESNSDGFFIERDLTQLDNPGEILGKIQEKTLYYGLLEIIKNSLDTYQTKSLTIQTTKDSKSNQTTGQRIIASSSQSHQNRNNPGQRWIQTKDTSQQDVEAQSNGDEKTKVTRMQAYLITLNKAEASNEKFYLDPDKISKSFNLASDEVVKLANEYLQNWNNENSTAGLEWLQKDKKKPNRTARFKFYIGGQPARIIVEMRKIDGHTKLIVIAILKRNDNTYKGRD